MRRRAFGAALVGAIALPAGLAGCGGGGGAGTGDGDPALNESSTSHEVRLRLGLATGRPVNRALLGSNVQWVDRGDGLLAEDGSFRPSMLESAHALAPSVLRYPGGVLAEVFHWEAARNEHAFQTMAGAAPEQALQDTLMDTARFLALCVELGAEPVITVNVATGSADEAARWVRAVNVERLRDADGALLPPVRFWEVGNEPYLFEDRYPSLYLTPEAYAARAADIAVAMRAANDGSGVELQLGLPVSAETRNGIPVPAQPGPAAPGVDSTGFTRRVLTVLQARGVGFDFAAVHNAYLPYAPTARDADFDRAGAYLAAAGASRTVVADLAAVRTLLAHGDGRHANLPLAITEWSPLFPGASAAAAAWSATPAGALFAADLVCTLAPVPEVLAMNHWSLNGNGAFGSFSADEPPLRRPVHRVLSMLADALPAGGSLIELELACLTMSTPSLGFAAAQRALPRLTALGARSADGSRLTLALVHKDPVRQAEVTLDLSAWPVRSAHLAMLDLPPVSTSDDGGALVLQQATPTVAAGRLDLVVPPHALALLTLELA